MLCMKFTSWSWKEWVEWMFNTRDDHIYWLIQEKKNRISMRNERDRRNDITSKEVRHVYFYFCSFLWHNHIDSHVKRWYRLSARSMTGTHHFLLTPHNNSFSLKISTFHCELMIVVVVTWIHEQIFARFHQSWMNLFSFCIKFLNWGFKDETEIPAPKFLFGILYLITEKWLLQFQAI